VATQGQRLPGRAKVRIGTQPVTHQSPARCHGHSNPEMFFGLIYDCIPVTKNKFVECSLIYSIKSVSLLWFTIIIWWAIRLFNPGLLAHRRGKKCRSL